MEIAPKGFTFCSWNSSPKDSFFVNGNRAQMTRFLLMEIEPKGLVFCSWNSSLEDSVFVQPRHPKFKHEQIIYTPPHLTTDHSHSLPVLIESTLQTQTLVLSLTLTQTSRCATPSLKPTPVLTTLTLKHKHLSSLSLSLKPRTAPLRVSNPHRSLQQITHTQTHIGPQSLTLQTLTHSLNLVLTNLIILQALTLT